MNTIKSTWYGWGTLCLAGGGAYYFAKQQINADRASRYNQERQKQERLHRLEAQLPFEPSHTKPKKKHISQTDHNSDLHTAQGVDHAGSPSTEAGDDAAPVGHVGDSSEDMTPQRSKYEGRPYTSKKGDRFS